VRKEQIGKIIFSKVLEMPLAKYLTYIEKITKGSIKPFSTHKSVKKNYFMLKQ